ncbi:MAG TPA: ATP-dependent 6-phosphofructokinase [Gemmatimonadales bacterium]
MRLAISTGGGDAPGLNAVIRAVVLSAHDRGWETFGILRGFGSVLERGPGGAASGWSGLGRVVPNQHGLIPLGPDDVRGITHLGGTILGASNRGNPFRWETRDAAGNKIVVDRSGELLEAFDGAGIDALITIGGDGSLTIAGELARKGLRVIGVPKTIDNDVVGTVSTFGFDTAVATATEAIDKLHSTAQSHDRVMVVELMGRHAGWLALHAGISGTADVILIPEIPFDIEAVCAKIRDREARGSRFAIVVVAEGAKEKTGDLVLQEPERAGRAARLGGIGAVVAEAIAERTGKETRSLVLGHLQRGGSPSPSDRLLALRFGAAAVAAAAEGAFGTCVVYTPPNITQKPLEEIVGRIKTVPLDSGVIVTARRLGVSLGD